MAEGVVEEVVEVVGVVVGARGSREGGGVAGIGVSTGEGAGTPVGRVGRVGLGGGIDEDKAGAEAIGGGGPGQGVVVAKLHDGAVAGVLELQRLAVIVEDGEVGELPGDGETLSVERFEGVPVANHQDSFARGEAGDGAPGEVEGDAGSKRHAGQIERRGVADIEQLHEFLVGVAGGVIHDFAHHQVELRVAGVDRGGGLGDDSPGRILQGERFPEVGEMPFVSALHEVAFPGSR